MRISFTVPGDPVPYLRMTQGQVKLMRIPDRKISGPGMKVKKKIRRYLEYKDRARLVSSRYEFLRAPTEKVYLNVFVYFSSRRHGDPENIRKGIQDAVFEQDRYVAGSVDFGYDAQNPRVEVEIIDGRD